MDLRIYPLKPLVLKAYEHPQRWISADLSGFIVDLSWMAFLTIKPNVKRMVKKYFGKLRSFHFFRLNFVLSPPGKKMPGRITSTNRAKFLRWYMAKLENSPLSPDAKAYMDAILSDDYWGAYMSQLESIQSKALETLNIMMANLRRMEEERKSLTNNTNQHEGE